MIIIDFSHDMSQKNVTTANPLPPLQNVKKKYKEGKIDMRAIIKSMTNLRAI